jgi:hypothetical protein
VTLARLRRKWKENVELGYQGGWVAMNEGLDERRVE